MKNIFLTIALIAGFGLCANAQTTSVKPAVKTTAAKTQKKVALKQQPTELKSVSENTAMAPLVLPIPKPEADTALVPVVKKDGF